MHICTIKVKKSMELLVWVISTRSSLRNLTQKDKETKLLFFLAKKDSHLELQVQNRSKVYKVFYKPMLLLSGRFLASEQINVRRPLLVTVNEVKVVKDSKSSRCKQGSWDSEILSWVMPGKGKTCQFGFRNHLLKNWF